MIFKCKMCGGELNIDSGSNICTCPFCKTKQTVPNVETEIEKQLFERANYYRFSNEFDKALPIYEQILATNPKEPEAFWGVLLCRYGVEYVEDAKTKKRTPTCHRTCYESILNDLNYKSALKYATPEATKIYEEEAAYIDKIQKKIKEISSKEKPYDIFICYKESDGDNRTVDSVIAEEIYENLTNKGYKVFFSRISLEGKLGIEYEPYIFAALTSAKIMLVVGCNKDNMNAVWVKNEWKRYLSLINEGKEKILIPCYKGMNPYDMPDEFSALQAQDMGKVGAMQDLLRGIDKIIKPSSEEIDAATVETHILKKSLEKAFEYLQQGKWREAEKRLDNAKDYDSHSAMVYLGYLLIDLRINNIEQLENYPYNYFENVNYRTALEYADKKLKSTLEKCRENTEKIIDEKNKEEERRVKKLNKLIFITTSIGIAVIVLIIVTFTVIIPNIQYAEASKLMTEGNYVAAYQKLDEMIEIKDSKDKKLDCAVQIQVNLIKENPASEWDKTVRNNIQRLGYQRRYIIAKAYYDAGNLEKFEEMYQYIKGYEDSDKLYGEYNYEKAMQEYNKTNYGTAKDIFSKILDYSDSKEKYDSCIQNINAEKQKYYGTWIENGQFWYNLKIDETGIYYASQTDTKRERWNRMNTIYKEDNGEYFCQGFSGEIYNVKVEGNRLTLVWTNKQDEYDTDWFGNHNKFYRK